VAQRDTQQASRRKSSSVLGAVVAGSVFIVPLWLRAYFGGRGGAGGAGVNDTVLLLRTP
jgi:hypothetical protein